MKEIAEHVLPFLPVTGRTGRKPAVAGQRDRTMRVLRERWGPWRSRARELRGFRRRGQPFGLKVGLPVFDRRNDEADRHRRLQRPMHDGGAEDAEIGMAAAGIAIDGMAVAVEHHHAGGGTNDDAITQQFLGKSGGPLLGGLSGQAAGR